VFWTVAIPQNAVSVHLDDGEAQMTMQNMPITDYFDIPNSLFRFEDPVSEPATCSFDIHWGGPITDVSKIDDPDQGYAGKFVTGKVDMTWRAKNASGFKFVSHPSPTESFFAQLGHMRNGIFYSPP